MKEATGANNFINSFEFYVKNDSVFVEYNDKTYLYDHILTDKTDPDLKKICNLLQKLALYIADEYNLTITNWRDTLEDFIRKYWSIQNNQFDAIIYSSGAIKLNLEKPFNEQISSSIATVPQNNGGKIEIGLPDDSDLFRISNEKANKRLVKLYKRLFPNRKII